MKKLYPSHLKLLTFSLTAKPPKDYQWDSSWDTLVGIGAIAALR